MLKGISWGNYWMAVLAITAIYYFLLVLVLYKKGVFAKPSLNRDRSTKPRRWQIAPEQTDLITSEASAIGEKEQDDQSREGLLMPMVHDLVNEIKEYLSGIAQKSFVREEIIMGLKIIIRNYKKLEGSAYQNSINDFMVVQCEENCSIHLSADETRRIWLGD